MNASLFLPASMGVSPTGRVGVATGVPVVVTDRRALTHGWLYSHQLPQEWAGTVIPGYTQIDRIVGGVSVESGSLKGFRARGYVLPDLPVGAAQGQYWVARTVAQLEAAELAVAAWVDEPAAVVRRHPTGGWTHAVKQAAPGVRIYRGWWSCRHDAAQALTPHVVRGGSPARAEALAA